MAMGAASVPALKKSHVACRNRHAWQHAEASTGVQALNADLWGIVRLECGHRIFYHHPHLSCLLICVHNSLLTQSLGERLDVISFDSFLLSL